MHLPIVSFVSNGWQMFHLKLGLHFFVAAFYVQTQLSCFRPPSSLTPGISLRTGKEKAEEVNGF